MREGICIAGNMLVDNLFPIAGYPGSGELTSITDSPTRVLGGAVCNVIVDLAMMDASLPLSALGIVGRDAEGDFILHEIGKYSNIDCSGVKQEGTTSFTLVMSDNSSKQRTFFHYRGANDHFCEKDIDWTTVHAKLLHVGYILLLGALDAEDDIYGTKMARLLANAKKNAIRTSIDVVTEKGSRFNRLVPPALKYTDYCTINEIEAQQTTGIPLRDESGKLLENNMTKALDELFSMGVSMWAVIHCPEGAFGRDQSGNYVKVESLPLEDGYIKGTVGAGDAFCSGILYAAYHEKNLAEAIALGIACASCSLSREGATEGMRPLSDVKQLYASYAAKKRPV